MQNIQDMTTNVTSGVRRCGKSTLMIHLQGILNKKNPETSILSINRYNNIPESQFLEKKDVLSEAFEVIYPDKYKL